MSCFCCTCLSSPERLAHIRRPRGCHRRHPRRLLPAAEGLQNDNRQWVEFCVKAFSVLVTYERVEAAENDDDDSDTEEEEGDITYVDVGQELVITNF